MFIFPKLKLVKFFLIYISFITFITTIIVYLESLDSEVMSYLADGLGIYFSTFHALLLGTYLLPDLFEKIEPKIYEIKYRSIVLVSITLLIFLGCSLCFLYTLLTGYIFRAPSLARYLFWWSLMILGPTILYKAAHEVFYPLRDIAKICREAKKCLLMPLTPLFSHHLLIMPIVLNPIEIGFNINVIILITLITISLMIYALKKCSTFAEKCLLKTHQNARYYT